MVRVCPINTSAREKSQPLLALQEGHINRKRRVNAESDIQLTELWATKILDLHGRRCNFVCLFFCLNYIVRIDRYSPTGFLPSSWSVVVPRLYIYS